MSTKVATLTIVAALALTIGVGSVQGDDFTDQDISGNNYDGLNLSNSIFLRANVLGTQFVGTILTGSDFTDVVNLPGAAINAADISGSNFNDSGLTMPQLITTGTWYQPNPLNPGDYNYYRAGFDPRGLGATVPDLALIGAQSLHGVTLEQGMDLQSEIWDNTLLDFRGTDFNGADLDNVDLAQAVFDRQTMLIEASTTVVVSGVLEVWDPIALARVPVAVASELEIHDTLTLTDAITGSRLGRLFLAGGRLVVDPGDVIVTSNDNVGRSPNEIEIQPQRLNVIEVRRDSLAAMVVQMDNPIGGGGTFVAPAPQPLSILTIEGAPGQEGILSLNGDGMGGPAVTFEGVLDIGKGAVVALMGDYIPEPTGLGPVEADLQVGGLPGQDAVLMGTGRISMNGVGVLHPDSQVTILGDGTFAPGVVVADSPDGPEVTIGGQMIVDNIVDFRAGSTFAVMIADDNDAMGVGVSSGMIVNNNVAFDAASSLEVLVENQPNPFPPTQVGPGFITEQRIYLVLETLGEDPSAPGFQYSITGQPDWVNPGPAPAMLDLDIIMLDDSGDSLNDQMWLDVRPNGQKFAAFARNHNQRTIAKALDTTDVSSLPANEQADADALLGELQWVPANRLGHEMQLLAGVETVNNGMATLQTIRGLTDRTNDWLYQLRRAARKDNAAGSSLRNNTELVAADEAADADAAAALQAMSYDWHIRADAIGIWGNVDNDGSSGSYGYSYDSYGFMLAIERMVAPNLMIGMTLAGFTTDLDGDNGSGDAESDTLFMDLHGTYTMGDFYVNAVLGYAHSWIDSHRHTIGGRRPDGSTESNYYTAGLELGYNLDFEAVNVEPYVRLDYAYSRTDGWNEHNGGAANTNWNAWKHRSLRSSLGARLEVPFSLASMPARVRTDLAWEHEFNDSKADANGGFLGVPINVQSADLGNDALRAGVELEVDITENISLSGGYQFRGNHDWDQHMASLTLKCAW